MTFGPGVDQVKFKRVGQPARINHRLLVGGLPGKRDWLRGCEWACRRRKGIGCLRDSCSWAIDDDLGGRGRRDDGLNQAAGTTRIRTGYWCTGLRSLDNPVHGASSAVQDIIPLCLSRFEGRASLRGCRKQKCRERLVIELDDKAVISEGWTTTIGNPLEGWRCCWGNALIGWGRQPGRDLCAR